MSYAAGLLWAAFALQDPAAKARELVEKLGSDSVEERDEARRKLYELQRDALPALEKAAASGDAEISARAKDMLADFPRKAYPALFAALNDIHRPLDAAAFRGVTGAEVLRFLRDSDPTVRGRAADALGRMGVRDGVTELLALHQDRHHFVRVHAAGALRELGAVDELREFLGKVWGRKP